MKKIIVCCDGTWNRADQQSDGEPCPTNVIRIAYRIAKRAADGVPQIVFYHQGVGTGNALDRYTGGALGKGLEANIQDCYLFLIANYEPGDEIFLFGFSRGAFTARSLGGMIRKVGILKRESVRKYREAVNRYRSPSATPDDPESLEFRKQHSIAGAGDIEIKLIGVWDTVGALGIPLRGLRWLTSGKYQFHDTALSKTVKFAYHALSIDERRAPFEPTLWLGKPKPGQTVEQAWFCGVHSDVGGGYPERGLSDIALEWMIGKARDNAGLAFDAATMAANPMQPNHRGLLHDSKKGLYNLTKGADRRIGVATDLAGRQDAGAGDDPTQSLHPSVRKRWDEDRSYRPASLRAYFKRVNDPRAQG